MRLDTKADEGKLTLLDIKELLDSINNSLNAHKFDINVRFNNLDDKLINLISENTALAK
jgi:hypothetical protein